MQKQILPLWLRFNLIQDKGQVLLQVAQADVAKGVGGGRLHLLTVVVETFQNGFLQASVLAQVAEKKVWVVSYNLTRLVSKQCIQDLNKIQWGGVYFDQ